jgi:hypothetical protein
LNSQARDPPSPTTWSATMPSNEKAVMMNPRHYLFDGGLPVGA